jgi:hypothetical protein
VVTVVTAGENFKHRRESPGSDDLVLNSQLTARERVPKNASGAESAENSRRKNQEHKHREQQQVDATLQNICLPACKRNDAHAQRQQQ